LFKITGITLALAAVVAAMTLSACSSGPAAPPSAAQVLAADGYAHSTSLDAMLAPDLAPAGASIAGYAVGTNGTGLEAVVIINPADTAQAQEAMAVQSQAPGATETLNGDVLRITSPY
jgi:hypothetical protein